MPEKREPIYCDCGCGELMAERVGHKIIIQRLRGKRRHFKIIDIAAELKLLDNEDIKLRLHSEAARRPLP